MLIGILLSCNGNSPENLLEEAKLMRSENKIKETIISLRSIIKRYPAHDLAAKSQFMIADMYLNDVKDYNFSIEEFQKSIKFYPDHEVAKNSLFMIAYIYNNYLNSYTDAINSYNLFIKKYPEDELIPSVKYELRGLFDIEAVIDSLNLIVNQKNNI